MWVRSLAPLSGLGVRHCCELWCRSQMWLRPPVAVAVAQAGSCNSNSTPSLGTSICCMCGLQMQTYKKPAITNTLNKKYTSLQGKFQNTTVGHKSRTEQWKYIPYSLVEKFNMTKRLFSRSQLINLT